ncbi:MAG: dihydroorotate dehydrogenase-like protein [Gloeobacteraceae cyanobacterium ES-bin-144]|nr:dihydroorotate dehydrogenase-like protein [Verrucomicrobiales bacterium]
MDLTTNYLGLTLKNPVMPGASPLVDQLDSVRRLEDAGAAAVVMHSLFEEQITNDQIAEFAHTENPAESFSEAVSYFPHMDDYVLGPDRYLEQIARIKESVDIPVIGSLNGISLGGWTDHARLIEQAGADALELNVYYVATDPDEPGVAVEKRTLDILQAVKESITIPVAVKLSPFFSSPGHFAKQLDALGAAGVILFNRFYQPDIDIEELEATHRLDLSNSTELRLRLRWAAILHGHLKADIAVSGGVHTVEDIIKAIMCGANAVQVVSCLLKYGPSHIGSLINGLSHWLEDHDYESIDQMRGSMSLQHCPDPTVFERANYLRVLQLWKV